MPTRSIPFPFPVNCSVNPRLLFPDAVPRERAGSQVCTAIEVSHRVLLYSFYNFQAGVNFLFCLFASRPPEAERSVIRGLGLFCDKRTRTSLKTSSPFDFSFYDQMKATHAEIHLQRVCNEMVAMILVVNPAIHLVAQAHAKQSFGRQQCGPQFGSWREGGLIDLQYE